MRQASKRRIYSVAMAFQSGLLAPASELLRHIALHNHSAMCGVCCEIVQHASAAFFLIKLDRQLRINEFLSSRKLAQSLKEMRTAVR